MASVLGLVAVLWFFYTVCGQEISMPDQKKSVGYTGIDKHQNYIDSTTTLYNSCTRNLHNEMSLKAHCTIMYDVIQSGIFRLLQQQILIHISIIIIN